MCGKVLLVFCELIYSADVAVKKRCIKLLRKEYTSEFVQVEVCVYDVGI